MRQCRKRGSNDAKKCTTVRNGGDVCRVGCTKHHETSASSDALAQAEPPRNVRTGRASVNVPRHGALNKGGSIRRTAAETPDPPCRRRPTAHLKAHLENLPRSPPGPRARLRRRLRPGRGPRHPARASRRRPATCRARQPPRQGAPRSPRACRARRARPREAPRCPPPGQHAHLIQRARRRKIPPSDQAVVLQGVSPASPILSNTTRRASRSTRYPK